MDEGEKIEFLAHLVNALGEMVARIIDFYGNEFSRVENTVALFQAGLLDDVRHIDSAVRQARQRGAFAGRQAAARGAGPRGQGVPDMLSAMMAAFPASGRGSVQSPPAGINPGGASRNSPGTMSGARGTPPGPQPSTGPPRPAGLSGGMFTGAENYPGVGPGNTSVGDQGAGRPGTGNEGATEEAIEEIALQIRKLIEKKKRGKNTDLTGRDAQEGEQVQARTQAGLSIDEKVKAYAKEGLSQASRFTVRAGKTIIPPPDGKKEEEREREASSRWKRMSEKDIVPDEFKQSLLKNIKALMDEKKREKERE